MTTVVPGVPPARPATPIAVVGNPENRRVTLFTRAVTEAGLPAPRVVPWTRVLRDGGAAFAPEEVVRLDSPGENPEVDRLLRGTDDPTRVEGSARWYAGFLAAVRGLRGGVRLDDPDELAVLFDKRRCHAVLRAAGVPVPASPTSGPAAAPVGGWDDVRRLMREHHLPRLFVKPAHGSSASGVLAVESGPRGRVRATTSVEAAPGGRLFNSLRVRRLEDERDIAALVDALAPDGLHLERWLPKASQDGRAADLRIVVIAGRATHAVVRTSAFPLTNLHLGGRRGDLDAARRAFEDAGLPWAEVLATCERAAACFPRTLCVGVDLLPAAGWRRVAVGEVNAFGDLLPRLTGLPGSGAEGLDTYAAQLAALLHAPHAGFAWRRVPDPSVGRETPARRAAGVRLDPSAGQGTLALPDAGARPDPSPALGAVARRDVGAWLGPSEPPGTPARRAMRAPHDQAAAQALPARRDARAPQGRRAPGEPDGPRDRRDPPDRPGLPGAPGRLDPPNPPDASGPPGAPGPAGLPGLPGGPGRAGSYGPPDQARRAGPPDPARRPGPPARPAPPASHHHGTETPHARA